MYMKKIIKNACAVGKQLKNKSDSSAKLFINLKNTSKRNCGSSSRNLCNNYSNNNVSDNNSLKVFSTLYSKNNIKFYNPNHRRQFHTSNKLSMGGDDSSKTEETEDGTNETTDDDEEIGEDNKENGDSEHLKKIEELEQEVKDMKDKYMRSLAEVDNVRNIAKRDVQNATTYASQKFAKALLDTADNLTRALEHVPQDELETNEVLKTFHEGVVMTETNLQKTFKNNGIIKFGELGDEFDPAIHEAMFQIPDPNATPNTIGQLLSCGYMFKDRVLRPAQVGTYKGE
jgi:molecular chaperone GrpE